MLDFQPVYLDFKVDSKPRYGWGNPPHELLYKIINNNRNQYISLTNRFLDYSSHLATIPIEKPDDTTAPYWHNTYFGGLNAVALYCFPCLLGSRLYVEIGSGNSTKFVRRSIIDNGLPTKIVSIDPTPRAEIDEICDEVIREPLERIDTDLFADLHDGDILMIDGSHRCLQNSDVVVIFLEILPKLNPGVLIYFDDIYLPYDYPPEWGDRYYSEQYMLATLLLSDDRKRYEIVLPHIFMNRDKELNLMVSEFWKEVGIDGGIGNGMWIRVRSTE